MVPCRPLLIWYAWVILHSQFSEYFNCVIYYVLWSVMHGVKWYITHIYLNHTQYGWLIVTDRCLSVTNHCHCFNHIWHSYIVVINFGWRTFWSGWRIICLLSNISVMSTEVAWNWILHLIFLKHTISLDILKLKFQHIEAWMKWLPFYRWHFEIQFLYENYLTLIRITEVCS